MHQMYQSLPFLVLSFSALRFGRGGYSIAQPLDHSWLHSVAGWTYTRFFDASVQMTSDSSPAGSCPNTGSKRRALLCSTFSYVRNDFGLESSGLLLRQRRWISRFFFLQSLNLFVQTEVQRAFVHERRALWFGRPRIRVQRTWVQELRIFFCSIFSLDPYRALQAGWSWRISTPPTLKYCRFRRISEKATCKFVFDVFMTTWCYYMSFNLWLYVSACVWVWAGRGEIWE